MGGQKIIKACECAVIAVVGFFIVMIFGANVARAADDITVIGFIEQNSSGDYVLTLERSPYLLEDTLYIYYNKTLIIESGVVLKMGSRAQILIDGILDIRGTSENPVIITSYKDDEYGGDTNGDGDDTSPGRGNWGRFGVNDGAMVLIDNAIIRYGGDRGSSGGMIELYAGSTTQIQNSVIEYSSNGIEMTGRFDNPSDLSVSNSIFRNNSFRGLEIAGNSSVSFSGNTLNNNARGMRVRNIFDDADFSIHNNSFFDNGVAGFEFIWNDTLDVSNNWWGSVLGPMHPDNPAGDGDVLTGNVIFSPWTSQNPANSAPVLSFAGDSGYESDGIEPNISFVNDSTPVFKVAFSDADSDVAQYVRLVVGDDLYAMATSSENIFEFAPNSDAFGKGEYAYHFEASDGEIAVRLPESGELGFEVRFVPVILVPGIMGTELWKGDDLIWPDIINMLTDAGDDFMNILDMNYDGTINDNQVITGDIIRKPIITKDIFEGLVNEFFNAGYSENTDLFVFPYDWRLDIRTSAQSLKYKIDTILDETGSQNIDIVAHSMGGLLAKQYVLDNSHYLIDKLVFIGTPHLGATQAAKTLLFGDNLSMKIIFPFLSSDRIKYISQNMPAIYELLPSREFINQSSYYYYDHTQSDVFDFDRTEQFLKDSGLNPILLASADEFHNNLDNFDVGGINTYNINGCNTPTITTIIKRSAEEYSALLFEGDGTVPLASSKAINTPSNKTYYFNGVQHSTMPSASGIKDLIVDIITSSEISLSDSATQDSSQCVVAGKLVSVHSPVNLHIYDSEGNHVGRGENGDIEYNISGVVYEEIGENKFVFLPESGGAEYRVELDGTDSGTFSLRVSKVENSEVIETAYYSDIPVNTESEAVITLSENVSSTVLQVDESGSGSFQTVSVSSVLSSQESEDMTKPITTIRTTGGTSSAVFTLSAIDDNSGILKTEYSLDNGDTWNNYANSVIISSIGETTVLYRSKDRAGNLENYNSETIRVASASVILTPFINAPTPSSNEAPEVLGIKIERPKNEQYSNDDILGALKNADIDMLMDYLGKERNIEQEKSVTQKYGFDSQTTNFVCYGTKSTDVLGIGERAGVIYSFKEAFNRFPETEDDWNDVIRIATNQVPVQRSASAEQRIRDLPSVALYSERRRVMIAYGLRPEKRDLEKEIQGIMEFVKIYNRVPDNTLDWNILRSIVY